MQYGLLCLFRFQNGIMVSKFSAAVWSIVKSFIRFIQKAYEYGFCEGGLGSVSWLKDMMLRTTDVLYWSYT